MGIVVRNSFVDKDSEMIGAVITKSCIYNSRYKAIKKGEYFLSCVMITKSCLDDTELYGHISISDSSISKSSIEWQDIENMVIEEDYLMEYYKSDDFDETGEILTRRISAEPVTKADEDVKQFFLNYIESFNENDVKSSCEQVLDGTRDMLTNEEEGKRFIAEISDMEDYYNRFYGETIMEAIKSNLGDHNDSMRAEIVQKLNEAGYKYTHIE
jgi:hypothetical protein